MATAFDIKPCSHPLTEVRVKVASNGTHMFGRQCLECGRLSGTWIKKADAPESAPCWDEELENRIWRDRTAAYTAGVDRAKQERREQYTAYLQTPEWRERRRKVFERENGLCQGCREQRGAHVHHTTYEHLGNEPLFELVLLCRPCHEGIHPHMRGER